MEDVDFSAGPDRRSGAGNRLKKDVESRPSKFTYWSVSNSPTSFSWVALWSELRYAFFKNAPRRLIPVFLQHWTRNTHVAFKRERARAWCAQIAPALRSQASETDGRGCKHYTPHWSVKVTPELLELFNHRSSWGSSQGLQHSERLPVKLNLKKQTTCLLQWDNCRFFRLKLPLCRTRRNQSVLSQKPSSTVIVWMGWAVKPISNKLNGQLSTF